jgi:hypothetical protein
MNGGAFTLHYSISPGSAVGNPVLTPQGQALSDAYLIVPNATTRCGPSTILQRHSGNARAAAVPPSLWDGLCGAKVLDPSPMPNEQPDTTILQTKYKLALDFPVFESESETNFSPSNIANWVRILYKKRRTTELNQMLARIKAHLASLPPKMRPATAGLVASLRTTLPSRLESAAIPAGYRVTATG